MSTDRGSIMMVVSKYRNTGGRESVINNLSICLKKIGYAVSIGARVFESPPPLEIDMVNLTGLRNIMDINRSNSTQVIDSHQTLSNYYAFVIKKPFLFHYHGTSDYFQEINLKVCYSLLEKRLLRTISISNSASEHLRRRTGQSSKVIYNGVDSSLFKPSLEAPYRKGEPQLLFVGNLYPHKGAEKLVTMLLSLLKTFPNSHLIIIGTGKGYSRLHSIIDQTNMQTRVDLVGHVPLQDLPSYYCSCDIYVSASRFELFDLPALEAMACGKPILVSNIAAHKEIVEASRAGMIFSLDSIESFTSSLDRIYRQRNTFGNNGRKFAEENDWSAVAIRHSQIYDHIINQKGDKQ